MMPAVSTVVRKIDQKEIEILKTELDQNNSLWATHPISNTALNSGQTMIINWVTKINGKYQLQWTNRTKFPRTWELVASLANGNALGRVYWHSLRPGEKVLPHTDISVPYIRDGNIDHRYNIFFDFPSDLDFFVDGSSQPEKNTQDLEYTLYDSSTDKIHAVKNNNGQGKIFYALVIDILSPGITVAQSLFELPLSPEITG
jgi:hypothetical protein